ncbi:flavin reductase (DIM6/NTAB) family NADH-FMN oxidoreductase RutF [Streptomyces sp. TLI_55]|uniref:flavin reductase family protein n=1 Tax=Streptomyces sp. TLI_55 TaxID=1938861 RepID=UPI000BD6E54F|nr:flavin reductase family protein [Streptomyces sp. TLI_55]SNX58036.1 flavin reductase (DIM6/NTAB) family NADH-FMN oxidoreductase RutF [Streptomyces sp. TLI_55]
MTTNVTLRNRWSSQERALRRLAAPVSVLTAVHEGHQHGTTVSTVTRVSRRPQVLGVCLRPDSVLAKLATAEGRFAVNMLSAAQGPLARHFAESSRPDGAAQFQDIDWNPAAYSGAPLFAGALAHYDCRVVGRFTVGDHEVLLGAVVHAYSLDGDPLVSQDGELYAGTLIPVADHDDRTAQPPAPLGVDLRLALPLTPAKENVPT